MEKVSDLTLIYGTTSDDRTVCHLIDAAGIGIEWVASGQKNTPRLIHGYRSHDGLKEITEFVRRLQTSKTPRQRY